MSRHSDFELCHTKLFYTTPQRARAWGVEPRGANAIEWPYSFRIVRRVPGLGGANSQAYGVDENGQVVGLAESSDPDPKTENFCGFNTNHICLPFLWQNGVMTPLATLCGHNGQAYAMNNLGVAAGVAENSTPDPTCPPPQVFDFEAAKWVTWQPDQKPQELPPYTGDSVGFALGLNDFGWVVGSSGSCEDTVLQPFQGGPRAVLWQGDTPIDLGNLGAAFLNVAAAVNDFGVVTGGSSTGGGSIHTFLWTQPIGKMQDLGAVGADVMSFSTAINNQGQIVGQSCDANSDCRAYLWQNGHMMDLNALIPSNSGLYLLIAQGINDAGEIEGQALEKSTGELIGFLATPRRGGDSDQSLSPVQTATNPMVLPEYVRS